MSSKSSKPMEYRVEDKTEGIKKYYRRIESAKKGLEEIVEVKKHEGAIYDNITGEIIDKGGVPFITGLEVVNTEEIKEDKEDKKEHNIIKAILKKFKKKK